MMHVHEPAKDVPVYLDTEVLVVGAGPGGLAAAISAAREGVRTTLVERYGCFGGVITQVGVESFAWYRHEGTTDVEGIGIEFEQRAKALGATRPEPQSDSEALDPEMFKWVADQLVQEAGVEPVLHCFAVEAITEGNTIRGVITESKSGRQAILAERVIDASGDADIAYRAGAPCHKTPVGQMMGVTVTFSCSNVNQEAFLEYIAANPASYRDWRAGWQVKTTGKEDALFSPYLEEPFVRARQDGLIPDSMRDIRGTWGTITEWGEVRGFNVIFITDVDPTDVGDLTRAEIEGRRQAMVAIEALRRYVPGFKNARLRNFSTTLGVRDSRKIVGRYNLTGKDVLGQARFADSIGIFPEFVDGYGRLVLPTTGRYFQVPYGILVPKTVENLLVAGRCVAGDAVSHAAVRSQMCCTVTGQGAGVAAAVSLKDRVSPRRVDVARLQRALAKQGVRTA